MAGGLGITPGLDTLGILIMSWILAPVDITLTWIRLYKEAAEYAATRGIIIADTKFEFWLDDAGQLVLMDVFGAGLTYGSVLVRW